MERQLTTPRQLRFAPNTRRGKNRHSTGREKMYVNPFMMGTSFHGSPIFIPRRRKLKGWQKENRRNAA